MIKNKKFSIDSTEIYSKISEYLENKETYNVLSFLGVNGIGKTCLTKNILKDFCNCDYLYAKKDFMDAKANATINLGPVWSGLQPKFKSPSFIPIYLNEFLKHNRNIFLPENMYQFLLSKSFSANLRLDNYLFHSTDQFSIQFEIFKNNYQFWEKYIPKIDSISFDSSYFLNDMFLFNSTGIRNDTLLFTHNNLERLAFIIDYFASFLQKSIIQTLNLFNLTKEDFTIIIEKKIIERNLEFHENQRFILNLIKSISFVFNMPELINFFKEIHQFNYTKSLEVLNLDNNSYINGINQYSIKIQESFNISREFLKIYFPHFANISLNKRYVPSLDIFVYDFLINEIPFFEFINNCASKGEVNIYNLLFLFIHMNSLDNFNRFLLISDDAFDSNDNSNYSLIFHVLAKFLSQERFDFIFINFTHDYRLFREFNKKFNKVYINKKPLLSRDEIFLLDNQNRHNIKLIPFKILNNFYNDYLISLIFKKNSIEINLIYIISLASHYRNSIENIYSQNHNDYLTITNILHIKKNKGNTLTKYLSLPYIKDLAKSRNINLTPILNYCKSKKLITIFLSLKSYIDNNQNLNLNNLEIKLFMSILSRLMIENYILYYCNKNRITINLEQITSNQTGELIKIIEDNIYTSSSLRNIFHIITELNSNLPDFMHTQDNEIDILIHRDSNYFYKCFNNFLSEYNKLIK